MGKTEDEVMKKQIGGEHYKKHKFQSWDIIDEYGLNFYEGNALKYLLREKGNRREDLEKAIHYLEKELVNHKKRQAREHNPNIEDKLKWHGGRSAGRCVGKSNAMYHGVYLQLISKGEVEVGTGNRDDFMQRFMDYVNEFHPEDKRIIVFHNSDNGVKITVGI